MNCIQIDHSIVYDFNAFGALAVCPKKRFIRMHPEIHFDNIPIITLGSRRLNSLLVQRIMNQDHPSIEPARIIQIMASFH